MLPTDAQARKAVPLYSGLLRYFPDALAAVAALSKKGNDQHNPGKPLHWDRSKSGDEHDALMRHLIEAGRIDTDGIRHSAKVAWRALAALQKEIERASVDAVCTITLNTGDVRDDEPIEFANRPQFPLAYNGGHPDAGKNAVAVEK